MNAIVFDAVGTLLVPARPVAAVYAETANRFGIELDVPAIADRFRTAFHQEEAIDAASGWRVDEDREFRRWRSIVAMVLPGCPEACFRNLYDYYAEPEAWTLSEGVAETLSGLTERGWILGMASNLDHRLTKIVAGIAELRPLGDRIAISSQLGYRKPHPAFFAAVAAMMRCPPGCITFVGDDLRNDYEGASQAGFRAILYDPENRHSGVSLRIESISDLGSRFPH